MGQASPITVSIFAGRQILRPRPADPRKSPSLAQLLIIGVEPRTGFARQCASREPAVRPHNSDENLIFIAADARNRDLGDRVVEIECVGIKISNSPDPVGYVNIAFTVGGNWTGVATTTGTRQADT